MNSGAWLIGRIKCALTILILTLSCNGCAGVGIAVKAGTAAASAAGSYWSYKAYQQDPVSVTTLSKECTFIHYVSVPCDQRAAIRSTPNGEATLKEIAKNNQLAVELCGIEKPPSETCAR